MKMVHGCENCTQQETPEHQKTHFISGRTDPSLIYEDIKYFQQTKKVHNFCTPESKNAEVHL